MRWSLLFTSSLIVQSSNFYFLPLSRGLQGNAFLCRLEMVVDILCGPSESASRRMTPIMVEAENPHDGSRRTGTYA